MRRALLLEDSNSCAVIAMRHLMAAGYVVERYDDVYRARMACARKNFMLYVIDVNVRDGNGLDFVRWLKSTHTSPTVIIWTSMPQDVTSVHGTHYAAKDANGEQLLAVIEVLV